MEVIVHRGTHMIGGSCVELCSGSSSLFLDAGARLPGVGDNNLPEGPELDLKKIMSPKGRAVEGVLFSHCHGDHTGLMGKVPYNVKVFMGEKTESFLALSACFTIGERPRKADAYLKHEEKLHVGPFTVTPYAVDHSAAEAFAFMIEAEGKNVLYSGDFRRHGNKAVLTDRLVQNLKKIDQGVDLLIMEGTVLGRKKQKTLSERQLSKKAEQFMKKTEGPVFVLQSSNNIDRLVGMYKAARNSGRTFVMDPYTAHVARLYGSGIPNPLNFNQIKVFYPRYLTKRMYDRGHGDLMKELNMKSVSSKELSSRHDYCLMIRDSMLYDLKERIHPGGNGGIIYSMWEGYLKSSRMKKLMEYAKETGLKVAKIHTSGHADIDALKSMVDGARPKKILPVHTELPNDFNKYFQNVISADDGIIIAF